MPGNDLHKIQKAIGLQVDCICMDLEDGTALNQKAAARVTIANALRTLDFGRSERLVRVNPFSSGMADTDLAAVLPALPDGIVLPKVNTPDEIRRVCALMSAAEEEADRPAGSMALIAVIETAWAFLNLAQICAADSRLQALIFGGEDLAADLGATRTPAAAELAYGRGMLVMHAAAFELQAIDMVTVDFTDLEAVRRDARQSMELGFSGKQIIHPRQIAPVVEAFTPSEAEVARALALVEAFREFQKQGSGAFAFEGQMVDMPVIRRAEQVLARALVKPTGSEK